MEQICELNDRIVLGTDGMSAKTPRITARAIVKNKDGLYAVMYADKFKLHSLPGGGVEDGEDVLTALRREVYEEWVTFDELVRLINDQEFDRIQGKYLKARDVASLKEYSKLLME